MKKKKSVFARLLKNRMKKSVKDTNEAITRALKELEGKNSKLHGELAACDNYLGQLYHLENTKHLPREAKNLKTALEAHAESRYNDFQSEHVKEGLPYEKELLEFKHAIKETKNVDKVMRVDWNFIQRNLFFNVEPKKIKSGLDTLKRYKERIQQEQKGERISPRMDRKIRVPKFAKTGAYTAKDLYKKIEGYKGSECRDAMRSLKFKIASRSLMKNEEPMTTQEIFSGVLQVVAEDELSNIHPKTRIGKLLVDFHKHNPQEFEAALNDGNTTIKRWGEERALNEVLGKKFGFQKLNKELGNDAVKEEDVSDRHKSINM